MLSFQNGSAIKESHYCVEQNNNKQYTEYMHAQSVHRCEDCKEQVNYKKLVDGLDWREHPIPAFQTILIPLQVNKYKKLIKVLKQNLPKLKIYLIVLKAIYAGCCKVL